MLVLCGALSCAHPDWTGFATTPGVSDSTPPARTPPAPSDLPPSMVQALTSSVEQVSSEAAGPLHASTATAVRALADVIAALPGAERAPDAMRSAADALEYAPGAALTHTDFASNALQWAIAGLARAEVPQGRKDAHSEAVARLGDAVARIAPGTPLEKQRPQVEQAFQSAADAALIAHGLAPAFGGVAGLW
jgi:hypothetical protein